METVEMKELELLKEKLGEIEKEKNNAEEKIKKLGSVKQYIEELTNKKEEANNASVSLDKIEQDLSALKKKIQAKKDEISACKKSESDLESELMNKMDELTKALDELESKMIKESERLISECDKVEESLKDANANLINNHDVDIEKPVKESEKLNSEISAWDPIKESSISQILNPINSLKKDIKSLSEKTLALESDLLSFEDEEKKLENEKVKADDILKQTIIDYIKANDTSAIKLNDAGLEKISSLDMFNNVMKVTKSAKTAAVKKINKIKKEISSIEAKIGSNKTTNIQEVTANENTKNTENTSEFNKQLMNLAMSDGSFTGKIIGASGYDLGQPDPIMFERDKSFESKLTKAKKEKINKAEELLKDNKSGDILPAEFIKSADGTEFIHMSNIKDEYDDEILWEAFQAVSSMQLLQPGTKKHTGSPEKLHGLPKYTVSYREFNTWLRNIANPVKQTVASLKTWANECDEDMSKCLCPFNMILKRGIGKYAPPFSELKKGDIFVDQGMISTTYSSSGGFSGELTLFIRVRKGSHISFAARYSGYPSEQEVVLPRSSAFKVLDVELSGKEKKIYMELIQ